MRKTISSIQASKGKTPLVGLTAYTTPTARQIDAACDIVLVGDSLGMVLHGLPSTIGVTMEMMILHGKAVSRGLSQALMVVDLPFGAYEASAEQAFLNAARLMTETGAQAVKVEGGAVAAATIGFLTARGIPVVGHIGLTPQTVHALGGYRVQGRGAAAAAKILEDARSVAEAGAFALVLEKMPASLARAITAEVPIPTIGIGAGPDCDGQILVTDDMLGVFEDFRPKFARQYADVATISRNAVLAYADDVRAGRFPSDAESYKDEDGA